MAPSLLTDVGETTIAMPRTANKLSTRAKKVIATSRNTRNSQRAGAAGVTGRGKVAVSRGRKRSAHIPAIAASPGRVVRTSTRAVTVLRSPRALVGPQEPMIAMEA